MTRILRDKFRSLLYGDDGAALVITLAVFFLLYLLCMGSFAVGTAVKERIQLQNTCDAAAYSAAVVQADTLSRIATLNRAMSWTYVQMTRRQMDHVVKCWLELVSSRYHADLSRARSLGSPGRHLHHYWQSDKDEQTLTLNRHWTERLANIDGHLQTFRGNNQSGLSYYAVPGDISEQISADKGTISGMNDALDELVERLPDRIIGTAESVFAANDVLGAKPKVFSSGDVFRPLSSGEEREFLRFSGYNSGAFATFETGSEPTGWFPLQNGEGFYRAYQQRAQRLLAEWNWWYIRWRCPPRSACIPVLTTLSDSVRGIDAWNSNFDGYRARPIVLKSSYFGKEGTITVGLARRNRNPLAAIWGDGDTIRWSGVLSAFNPFCQDTVVFSSAKAGYKRLGEEYDDAGNLTREYRIDWDDNQDWNLCQSDWDAVFVPVRMAQTMAKDGGWEASKNDFLGVWVEKLIGSSESMRSGGTKRYNPTRDDPLDYRHSRGWGRRPDYAKGLVVTEWQIEDKNKRPDWDRMTERMFH